MAAKRTTSGKLLGSIIATIISNQPTVKSAAERHAGRTLEDEIEVFATIRRWKDGFN